MDELPELPFEQMLSYLSLEDCLKAKAVSRRWYLKINSFRLKSLCYSMSPSGFIYGKNHLANSAFVEYFINSLQFTLFFNTFSQTMLSSLKRLCLCDLNLSEGDRTAFTRFLNSFSQLEELDIIRAELNQQEVFNLPMLTSLQLKEVRGIRLPLEAPRSWEVRPLDFDSTDLRVEIVHGESVKRLLVDCWEYTDVKNLKNLQFLYVKHLPWVDPTFLSSLQQLKEIHLFSDTGVSELFKQKQRLGRADLKIYLCGLLLDGPHDPARNDLQYSFGNLSRESLVCLAKNSSKLADKIPFYRCLQYLDIEELVSPGLEVDIVKRFIHLNVVRVCSLVQDVERFLNLLKNCKNISSFHCADQPQDLFDRLPEHCAFQKLFMLIGRPPSDLAFLFRLKHLIHLRVSWSIDSETIRRIFEELSALSWFQFRYDHKAALIQIGQSKQFQVSIAGREKTVSDLNAAIEYITGIKRPNKRKDEYLE